MILRLNEGGAVGRGDGLTVDLVMDRVVFEQGGMVGLRDGLQTS